MRGWNFIFGVGLRTVPILIQEQKMRPNRLHSYHYLSLQLLMLVTLHKLVYVSPVYLLHLTPSQVSIANSLPGVTVVLACQSPEGVHHKINLHASPQRHRLAKNTDAIELLWLSITI